MPSLLTESIIAAIKDVDLELDRDFLTKGDIYPIYGDEEEGLY